MDWLDEEAIDFQLRRKDQLLANYSAIASHTPNHSFTT